MEIGPIRNQNLIFWPLANVFVKIDKGQQKIKIVHCCLVGRSQDNGNRSNQESKFDFLATRQCLHEN